MALVDWHVTCSAVLGPKYYIIMNSRPNSVKDGPPVDARQTRACPRIRIQVPIFLRATDPSGAEFVELTKTLNISARGACITSTHMLRIDQTVQLTIPAPTPASSSLIPSETPPIAAKVRRNEILGDMRLFGLEFLRPLE